MTKHSSERKFYAGLVIVMGSFGLYGLHVRAGHNLTLYDLLFHAMPFTLGFALMVPKLFPALMVTVQTLWGKLRSAP